VSSSRSSRVIRAKREHCAARDGGWFCFYCRKSVHPRKATLDHVVPLILGGTWANENLRLACRRCNNRKGPQSPHVFHALLMQGLIA